MKGKEKEIDYVKIGKAVWRSDMLCLYDLGYVSKNIVKFFQNRRRKRTKMDRRRKAVSRDGL